MELVNRYLHAVGFWLPKRRRDDILEELHDDLEAEIDERQSTSARALTDSEIEDVIRRRGRPMLVASLYMPEQHLIAPSLVPVYWASVRFVCVPLAVATALIGLFAPVIPESLGSKVYQMWGYFFYTTGALIVALGLIEKIRGRPRDSSFISVDNYLLEVRRWLQGEHASGISEELEGDIRSQIADHETSLGRATSQMELADLLRKIGSPKVLAERYLPQEYLIGPSYFAIYRTVLKLALLVVVPLFLVIMAPVSIHTARSPGLAIAGTSFGLMFALCYTVGLVTLLFALIEKGNLQFEFLDRWKPLPPGPAIYGPIPRRYSAIGILLFGLFSIWWIALPRFPFLLLGRSFAYLRLEPVWQWYYWPVLTLVLAALSLRIVTLIHPGSYRAVPFVRFIINAIGLVVLLRERPYAVVTAINLGPASQMADNFNAVIFAILLGVVFPWIGSALLISGFGSVQMIRTSRRVLTAAVHANG